MNKAVRAAQRCALLPLPPSQKMSFLAAVAVSKAAFGWHAYVPPRNTFKKLQKAIKLSVWDHKSADVNLTAILRGHAVDIFFRIASNRLVCLYRQCARRLFTPQWWNNHKRFKITILKYADWIGWKASANWTSRTLSVTKILKLLFLKELTKHLRMLKNFDITCVKHGDITFSGNGKIQAGLMPHFVRRRNIPRNVVSLPEASP